MLEQTLTWGVDSLIKVPPRFRTTAELVVSEDSFQGNFSVRSDVSGKVSWNGPVTRHGVFAFVWLHLSDTFLNELRFAC